MRVSADGPAATLSALVFALVAVIRAVISLDSLVRSPRNRSLESSYVFYYQRTNALP